MSILSVDNIQPIGSGTSVTVNSVATLILNNANIAGVTTIGGDVSIADKIIHVNDTNTAIRFPANDVISFERAGGEALRITTAHAILTNGVTSEPLYPHFVTARKVQMEVKGALDVGQTRHHGSFAVNCTNSNSFIGLVRSDNTQTDGTDIGVIGWSAYDGSDFHQAAAIMVEKGAGAGNDDQPGHMIFKTNSGTTSAEERLRITSDGKIGVGVETPSAKLDVRLGSTGTIAEFRGADTDLLHIDGDSNQITLDARNVGALGFEMQGSAAMTIESSGGLRIGTDGIIIDHAGNGTDYETCSIKRTSQGVPLTIQTSNVSGGFPVLYLQSLSATSTQNAVTFLRNVSGNPITVVGIIQTTASSTSYGTSSDYRLKENEVLISDGITRLKTLKPYRFNWKIDPSTKVDGFFAHEVTAVPEAVSGTKDEVSTDENGAIPKGDPIYQTIDHSKLVPLLTAALQEAITRIETLEAKVSALEGS